jgi:hypothetical protein
MSHVLPDFKRAIGNAEIDIETADWRVMLVMLNSTVPTEKVGIVNLTDYTTADEFDGSGYTRKTLTGISFDPDSDDQLLSADNIQWITLGAGTRNVAGALFYVNIDGTDANAIPAFYYSLPGAPIGDDVWIKFDPGDTFGPVIKLR